MSGKCPNCGAFPVEPGPLERRLAEAEALLSGVWYDLEKFSPDPDSRYGTRLQEIIDYFNKYAEAKP